MGTDAPRTRRHRGPQLPHRRCSSPCSCSPSSPAGLGWWTVQRSFPTTSGRVDVPGLTRDGHRVPRRRGHPAARRRDRPRPLLRAGLRARAGPVLGDGLPPPRHRRPASPSCSASRRSAPTPSSARSTGAASPSRSTTLLDPSLARVLRRLRRRRERLPRRAQRRRPLARVRRARPAEPRLLPRAVDAGRLDRVAEGHGLGPAVEPRRRDRPGAARDARCPPRRSRACTPSYAWGDDAHDRRRAARGAPPRPRPRRSTPSRRPATDARRRRCGRCRDVRRRRRRRPGVAAARRSTASPSCSAPRAATSARTRGWSRARSPNRACRCSRTTRTSGPAMPSIWTQMGLHCAEVRDDCAFDVAGYTFSGLPGVIIGHNDRIAWGFTNLGPDVADLYLERVDGDTYELDGAQVPLTIARGDDRGRRRRPRHDHGALDRRAARSSPTSATTSPTSRPSTPRHPVSPTATTRSSLQWTALTPGTTPQAIFALEPRPATGTASAPRPRSSTCRRRTSSTPTLDGNIGYQAPGAIPVRAAGRRHGAAARLDERERLVGHASRSTSCRRCSIPPAGYIVTANNPAVGPDGPTAHRRTGTTATVPSASTASSASASPPASKLTADDLAEIQLDTADANAAHVPARDRRTRPRRRRRPRARPCSTAGTAAPTSTAPRPPTSPCSGATCSTTCSGRCPSRRRPQGGDRWFSVVGTAARRARLPRGGRNDDARASPDATP